MHSSKKRNFKKILSMLCIISTMSSWHSTNAMNKEEEYELLSEASTEDGDGFVTYYDYDSKLLENNDNFNNSRINYNAKLLKNNKKSNFAFKLLTFGSIAAGLGYACSKSKSSDSKNNKKKIKKNIQKNISSEIPEYLYGLSNSIDEELAKLNGNNKQNHYSLGSTAKRRFVASIENKSSIQRALESSKLYKKDKREVTCWDASLAFLYDIYEKHGPSSKSPINNINIGLVSYNIPIAFGLANHVFCYVMVDDTLFFVDPLLGVKISIDLTKNYEVIREQVTNFYVTQKNSNVLPSLGKLYNFLNKTASEISKFTKSTSKNSPYGKEGVFISDNIFVKNKKLSEIKWMSDVSFFDYLLKNKLMPDSILFNKCAPCKLFG